jgi:addiction module HigA family antidote
MIEKRRKPNHPGIILDELYIQPLNLNLQELAENLGISRNSLFKIRTAKASITPSIAIRLAEAFDTTPNLWLNLQQNYDLWIEVNEKKHKPIKSLYRTARTIKRRSKQRKVIV